MALLRLWLIALTLSQTPLLADEPLLSVVQFPSTNFKSKLENLAPPPLYQDPYSSDIYAHDSFESTQALIYDSLGQSNSFQYPEYLSVKPISQSVTLDVPYLSVPDLDAAAPPHVTVDPESEMPEGYSYSKALENFFPTDKKAPAKK